MAEQAIYTQLNTVAALGSRIYPLVLPQNVVYPAATYQRIGPTNRFPAFGGDANAVEATIQVDIYDKRAKGYRDLTMLAQSVRAALQRQSNADAIDMFLDTERDEYEAETDLLRKSYDVRVWYRET